MLFFVVNLSEENIIGEEVPYLKAVVKLYKIKKWDKPIVFTGLKSRHIIL